MTPGAAIDLQGLTKRYGARRGIEDVTLTVQPGEVFGFLGPNGAGKTTTIRTMLDLLRPTSGRAMVLGLDSHRDAVEIHRRIGYLPGDFTAYRRMTGRRYLAFFAELRGLPAAAYGSLAAKLSCDLEPQISALSHGNAQKLGLIQALMHDPEVLILDEPTQGLDPLVQHVFHGIVRERAAAGRTVFLSSHILPEVERTCDRVGIIGEGRLIAVEDVGQLRARAVRIVEFHFGQPMDRTVFEGISGVSDVEVHGDVVRCTVQGPIDALVKAAARFEIVDLQSQQPGLEELFLHYYRQEGDR
ncbi:MAG TPA: ABC transporter ATP-binding protein [Actinomycetota bacterium]|nr:ABC transporter ATP-binding protein [Actinomycetota bacterium]